GARGNVQRSGTRPTTTHGGPRTVLARPTLALLLSAAALAVAAVAGAVPASAGTSCVPPPVAHRGDSARAPENTLPAFRKALGAGARRLELDVRFTAGDVPVVMHDPT